MKRAILLILFSFAFLTSYSLEISVESACFKNDDKTYLETYVRILGHSAKFVAVNKGSDLLQSKVDLTIIIEQTGQIVTFEKFILNSPMLASEKDFLDVKRFALPPGDYVLKVEAIDKNDSTNKIELQKPISIHAYAETIELADVQLFGKVESSDSSNPLAKNGLYMESLTYGVVTDDIDVLNIYTEVYQKESSKDGLFIQYGIHEGYSFGNGKAVMKKVKKIEEGETTPLILQLPVDKLPSGHFHVNVLVFDKKKSEKGVRTIDFVRSNVEFDKEYWKTYDKDDKSSFVAELTDIELDYSLRAISPIVYEPKLSILNYIIKDATIRAKKKFLHQFWIEREPENTKHHYSQYLDFAKAIDLEYNSNVGYGFETDRGYIFLRYGKPSSVLSIDQEADSYPYEIWYYNYLEDTQQTNVRFLFYNKSLAHNDYHLLHSTCRLEKQDPNWEVELYRRGLGVADESSIDNKEVTPSWNRHARKYFNEY